MAVDPIALLRLFAEWLGLVGTLADQFAAEHPELVKPPDGPPAAPVEDLDPEVLAAIERGEL